MMRLVCLSFCALIVSTAVNAQENEQLVAQSKRMGVKVFAPSGEWCGPTLSLKFVADEPSFFKSPNFQAVTAFLSKKCPAAQSAEIIGVTPASKSFVFTGIAKAGTGWQPTKNQAITITSPKKIKNLVTTQVDSNEFKKPTIPIFPIGNMPDQNKWRENVIKILLERPLPHKKFGGRKRGVFRIPSCKEYGKWANSSSLIRTSNDSSLNNGIFNSLDDTTTITYFGKSAYYWTNEEFDKAGDWRRLNRCGISISRKTTDTASTILHDKHSRDYVINHNRIWRAVVRSYFKPNSNTVPPEEMYSYLKKRSTPNDFRERLNKAKANAEKNRDRSRNGLWFLDNFDANNIALFISETRRSVALSIHKKYAMEIELASENIDGISSINFISSFASGVLTVPDDSEIDDSIQLIAKARISAIAKTVIDKEISRIDTLEPTLENLIEVEDSSKGIHKAVGEDLKDNLDKLDESVNSFSIRSRVAIVDVELEKIESAPETLEGAIELRDRRDKVVLEVGTSPPLPKLSAYTKAVDAKINVIADKLLKDARSRIDNTPDDVSSYVSLKELAVMEKAKLGKILDQNALAKIDQEVDAERRQKVGPIIAAAKAEIEAAEPTLGNLALIDTKISELRSSLAENAEPAITGLIAVRDDFRMKARQTALRDALARLSEIEDRPDNISTVKAMRDVVLGRIGNTPTLPEIKGYKTAVDQKIALMAEKAISSTKAELDSLPIEWASLNGISPLITDFKTFIPAAKPVEDLQQHGITTRERVLNGLAAVEIDQLEELKITNIPDFESTTEKIRQAAKPFLSIKAFTQVKLILSSGNTLLKTASAPIVLDLEKQTDKGIRESKSTRITLVELRGAKDFFKNRIDNLEKRIIENTTASQKKKSKTESNAIIGSTNLLQTTVSLFTDIIKLFDTKISNTEPLICLPALQKSTLSEKALSLPILINKEEFDMRRFVCALDAGGVEVAGFEEPGILSTFSVKEYKLKTYDRISKQMANFVFVLAEARPGKKLLVATKIGDSVTMKDVSARDWDNRSESYTQRAAVGNGLGLEGWCSIAENNLDKAIKLLLEDTEMFSDKKGFKLYAKTTRALCG